MSLDDEWDDIMFLSVLNLENDPSHVTNFDKNQLFLYHQAITKDLIENEPKYSLEIRRDATDVYGIKIPGCYALHFGGMDRYDLDLSNFWNIFYALKTNAQAAVK